MKNNNVAFLTTIFSGCEKYLDDFFTSLLSQTYNFFDIIVVNDGVHSFSEYKDKYVELNIIDVISEKSPSKNREVGINKVIELNYKYVVFGDSDDYFSHNRVEYSLLFLKDFDVVVHDLTLFDTNGIIKPNYLSGRIADKTVIEGEFILDKNLFGLSNTAVRVEVLKSINLSFPEEIVAVDWYLFSTLMNEGYSSVFTSKIVTYYRQYLENTIGLGETNLQTVKRSIEIKLLHYKAMSRVYSKYTVMYKELFNVHQDVQYISMLEQRKLNTPLWWE